MWVSAMMFYVTEVFRYTFGFRRIIIIEQLLGCVAIVKTLQTLHYFVPHACLSRKMMLHQRTINLCCVIQWERSVVF